MRKILFRGKRLDGGGWAYGGYAEYIHPDCGLPSPSIIKPMPECGNVIVSVDPDTVGQFTGLLDRNGKEIYEGDILNNYDEPNPLIVKWDEGGCFFELYNEDGNCESDFTSLEIRLGVAVDAEIVGNIHEQSKN